METFVAFVLGVGSSLLASWAYDAIRNAMKTGRIDTPGNNSEVDYIQIFRGTSSLRKRQHLYLAVNSVGSDRIFPQTYSGPILPDKKRWESSAEIGEENSYNKSFFIYLLAVDDNAKKMFDYYREYGEKTKHWQAFKLKELPYKCRILDRIEVRRRAMPSKSPA